MSANPVNIAILCKEGKQLYRAYENLTAKHGWDHPRAHDAWLEWRLHKIGDATRNGCPICKGLKSHSQNE